MAFYTRTAAAMPAPLVVRCYDAVYAPEAKKFHLVLEDVSASHVQATVWPVPPVESTDRKFKSPFCAAPSGAPPSACLRSSIIPVAT